MIWQCRIAILVAIAVMTGCGRSDTTSKPGPATASDTATVDLVASARNALRLRNFPKASQLIQEALVASPNDAEALELAADLATQGGDNPGALEFYRRAIDASATPSKELFDKLGQQFMNAGRPFDSVKVLESAIKRYPDDFGLRQRMVGLQASLGLELESLEHLQWLVQRGHGSLNLLIILSDLSRPQTVEATCEYSLEHYPDDLRPQYSLARLPAYYSKWRQVADQLQPVIERHPAFVPAQAYYGRALVELGDEAAIRTWSQSLPTGIESHPQYWLAAGIWAEQQDDLEQAVGAFWHAALLNENEGEALTLLSSSLAKLDRLGDSKVVAQRAAKINTLRTDVDSLLTWRNNSQTASVKIAKTLDQLGRPWEATAWLQEAHRMTQSKSSELDDVYKAVRAKLTGNTPWQIPSELVAAKLDLSDSPAVDWRPGNVQTPTESMVLSESQIRFSDEAHARGLDHVCKLSLPPGQEAGLAIYQSGAGGVGVVDFDQDGWPDIYLTSIDGQPLQEDSSPNRLFRNQGGQFVEVTDDAKTGDRGFSQGIAVGDYNADGFPDLLVANIGRNRLFRNNGDGTFADVTDEAGFVGEDWTTSVAMADIDGDGHADVFTVGYCGGKEPLQTPCIDEELKEPRSCAPLAFAAQRDQVWRGRGDGTFVDVTDDWLGSHDLGRGLGIVVGDFEQDHGLDVYVANDMTANHFWSKDVGADDFRLSEEATVRGLAFNERSLSQASMGIAAGDADNDGDVDFLLTHFSGDYNTYYEQVGEGIWADRSNRVGLAAPSDRMLGYGTQWIDADNDGSFELLIANGDIDDFTHKHRFFRQPFQLFDRLANGQWMELPRAQVGKYFQRDYLARAIATLDADRDHRPDFLVTHLFDPVALLVNQSPQARKQIRFYLRGSQVHRDAIGTTVSIEVNGQTRAGQLLAGDGYQCSNERCVTFGLLDADRVDAASVTWPDGTSQSYGPLSANRDYLFVQQSTDAFELAR